MLKTDRNCSYAATRVNIALHFGTLKFDVVTRKKSSLPEKCDYVNTQQYSKPRAKNLTPFSSKQYAAFNIFLNFSTLQHR